MSARTIESLDAAPRDFDAGRLGRLSWLGLVVAALGWALLLGATVVPVKAGGTSSFHGDLVEIARCLVGSGFGLALIGALQTGFGALNRFFSAVLNRSARRTASAPVTTAPVDRSAAEPLRERRPYHILADGSVEVETIVGTRRFETMQEAREFI